jgi:hypothetical protein
MRPFRCPVCRRNAWITRAGVEQHLADDHSPGVLAAELISLVFPPQPEPTSTPPASCPKVSYESEDEALRALLSTWQNRSRRRRETRAYQCDRCPKWHLTSQPERTTE